MEHDMDISREMQTSDSLYMTQLQFEQLEKAMLDAIVKKPQIPPNRPGIPTEAEEILNLCHLAYDNDEIFSSARLWLKIIKLGNQPPVIVARLALFLSCTPDKSTSLAVAWSSISANPEETDAYFAVARVLSSADSPFQAECWFNIAKKGRSTMTKAMIDFENELKSSMEAFIHSEPSILAIISSPKELERFQNQARVKPWFNSQETKHGIARVRMNPTREILRTECATNVPFRRFVQRLTIVTSFLGSYSFTFLEGRKLASRLKQTGGLFYNWDQTLVSRLSNYLDLVRIIAQRTQFFFLQIILKFEKAFYDGPKFVDTNP